MEWQPIETYDALGIKPKHAVFFFEATKPTRRAGYVLDALIETKRYFGFRVCTHWMPLPPPPKGI